MCGAEGSAGLSRGCRRGHRCPVRGRRGRNITCGWNPMSQCLRHRHRQQCHAAEPGGKYLLCPAQGSPGSHGGTVPLAERSRLRDGLGAPHQLPGRAPGAPAWLRLGPLSRLSHQTRLLISPCFITRGSWVPVSHGGGSPAGPGGSSGTHVPAQTRCSAPRW